MAPGWGDIVARSWGGIYLRKALIWAWNTEGGHKREDTGPVTSDALDGRRPEEGGHPPPPLIPFQCLRLTTKNLVRRLQRQEDLSFEIFGGPKEEGVPARPPLSPPPPFQYIAAGDPSVMGFGPLVGVANVLRAVP